MKEPVSAWALFPTLRPSGRARWRSMDVLRIWLWETIHKGNVNPRVTLLHRFLCAQMLSVSATEKGRGRFICQLWCRCVYSFGVRLIVEHLLTAEWSLGPGRACRKSMRQPILGSTCARTTVRAGYDILDGMISFAQLLFCARTGVIRCLRDLQSLKLDPSAR